MPLIDLPCYRNIFACITFALVFAAQAAVSQEAGWQIHEPAPNTSIDISELFISVSAGQQYTISNTQPINILLDYHKITGLVKVQKNKLHVLYPGKLYPGKHVILVDVYIEELKKRDIIEWEFTVGNQYEETIPNTAIGSTDLSIAGTLVLDNRNEFLSGTGASLRQEPDATRTVSLDAALKYRNAIMPVRLFATSNNTNSLQSMNYVQVGFINKWLEVEVGDLNPTVDNLVLSGVRVRGVKTKFKYGASSLQLYYGLLNKAVEGSIENYVPGSGIVPANLVNDSQYVFPGTYKRSMMAARLETGDRSEIFKLGFNAFKAKDDTGSIKYGVAPKDNIAGGIDATIKLFKKSVVFHSGIAGSVFTNDISNGPVSKETLDTTFNIKIDFKPADYQDIIILNASTVPVLLDPPDFLSYFGKLNYNNKYQSFSFEYRRNGALYNSLGAPFFRNNYEGFSVGDRFSFYKRKFTVGLNYQDYSNNLNNSLPSKVYTKAYRANVFINIKSKLPTLYVNYMYQERNGKSEIPSVLGIDDLLSNYMFNIGYNIKLWGIDHHFFAMLNVNDRRDNLRPNNQFIAHNTMFGITEKFSERHSAQASYGKTIVSGGSTDARITDYNTYNLSFDWQIKPGKYFASISMSNTNTLATISSNQSNRLSAILRGGYKFYKGMELNLEGGYQPFRDVTITVNNYNETYFYIRYTSDLGALFAK